MATGRRRSCRRRSGRSVDDGRGGRVAGRRQGVLAGAFAASGTTSADTSNRAARRASAAERCRRSAAARPRRRGRRAAARSSRCGCRRAPRHARDRCRGAGGRRPSRRRRGEPRPRSPRGARRARRSAERLAYPCAAPGASTSTGICGSGAAHRGGVVVDGRGGRAVEEADSGVAISVVASVISTRMVNSVGGSARSRPMLSRISSIMPRAFMSVPMPSASLCDAPLRRAASQQATPLPRHAMPKMASVVTHSDGESTRPMRCAARVDEEQRDEQSERQGLISRRSSRASRPRGIAAPRMNAPNTEWTPTSR